jgi:DNA-directed RNA polymerase specialized sigma subunit
MRYRISYRDMEIYSAFTFQDQTKTEISREYGISIKRVEQIIHKVGYLLPLADYFEVSINEG